MNTCTLGQHNNNKAPKIVINATKVSAHDQSAEIYELVLDQAINVVSCSYVQSVSQARTKLIPDFKDKLVGDLFELNHVRIDPNAKNDLILFRLKKALESSGVKLTAPPDEILMAICYKPLGEINEDVRFYFKPDCSLVFLTKLAKLRPV